MSDKDNVRERRRATGQVIEEGEETHEVLVMEIATGETSEYMKI